MANPAGEAAASSASAPPPPDEGSFGYPAKSSLLGQLPSRGSELHPHSCKPCNKFFPGRDGSCKHGQACEYCHMEHDRPKHRGQRGRHALQRRQYLESKESLPEDLRRLIDEVYEVPHQSVEHVKRLLLNLELKEREDKACIVLDEMREIGEIAQNKRPDSLRMRGARIKLADEQPGLPELDARCKWLTGTLHLVVRKMQDAKEPVENMRATMNVILGKCRDLPTLVCKESAAELKAITTPLDPGLAEIIQIPLQGEIEFKFRQLAAKAQDPSRPFDELRAQIRDVVDGFKRLPDKAKGTSKSKLLSCKTLTEAQKAIEAVHDEFKELLFQAENSEDEMDIEDFAKSLGGMNFGASSSAAEKDERTDDEIEDRWTAIIGRLKPGYRCVEHQVEHALHQDQDINKVDPSETLTRLEMILEVVTKKLPSLVKFLQKLEKPMSIAEIEVWVRTNYLTPNHCLQDICDKLVKRTEDLADARLD